MTTLNKIKKHKLFKNTFLYTLMEFINKGLPFLLLPILTRYLTTDEYGIIAMYNTFSSFIIIFIAVSIPSSVAVNYFHLSRDELPKYISNVFVIILTATIISIILVHYLHNTILNIVHLPVEWIYIAILAAMTQTFSSINLNLWRSEERAKPFAIFEVSKTFINISISILLVVILTYGWEGRTTGIALTNAIFGILSIIFIINRNYFTLNISIAYLLDALKFGLSLIPHQLALWMRVGVDIFIISSVAGLTEVGIYSIGYQLGAIVGIAANAFNAAYSPYLYKQLKNITDDKKKKLVKFTYLYLVGILIFSILVATILIFLTPYLLGPSFEQASEYILLIAIAHAFLGMYLMVVNYIFYVKKTHLLSMTTISISVLHVIISYTLISIFGAIGAAYATIFTYFLTFIMVWRLSNRVYPLPWFTFYNKDLKNG